MKPIDLLPFAEFSEKLPSSTLTPEKTKEASTWQLLGSHFVDFGTSFLACVAMSAMFNQFMKVMLVTKGLKHAYSEPLVLGFAGPILPLMMFSYFFFSYFFNHGQTYGMHMFKIRTEMKHQSFRDAFTWAAYSVVLCFSGGLLFLFNKEVWKKVRSHDYLYENLVSHKENYQFDLLTKIEQFEAIEEKQDWSKAA